MVGDHGLVTATVAGRPRSDATFVERADPSSPRSGPSLEPIEFVMNTTWSDYGSRAGDSTEVYAAEQIVHAASWPLIANQFCHEQLVAGSWIHVRSRIVHRGIARVGARIRATAVVAERFESRAGKRVVLDVRINADGTPVASVEHEAIIELAA